MDRLNKLKADTYLAMQFFSALPVPHWFQPANHHSQDIDDPPKLNEAVTGFPVAGLLIALPPALLWYFASQFLPPALAATTAIALGAFITGALHEDGLADCFDGLGGASTRERTLEIMRDSTIGTYGAAALFFTFTLRIAALASFSPWLGALAILMAHSVARGSMVIAIHGAKYARPSGLADSVRSGTDNNDYYTTIAISLAIAFVIALVSGYLSALVAALLGFLAAWSLLQWLISRIGGYTGDGLGAMEQVAEVAILIALAVIWT
ncbi:MAG: adenosylcobinamide-GDP ribazoletransferase [Hyphomicrobiales bacterium]|nr:adenosylcobinamide-GDP ribazoletransferase [Hyphomicrobiales bacterium]